jgi:hypothetical protein
MRNYRPLQLFHKPGVCFLSRAMNHSAISILPAAVADLFDSGPKLPLDRPSLEIALEIN